MSRTPKTDEVWADAVARPSRKGDWQYVAEEMARLCRELENVRADLYEEVKELEKQVDDLSRENASLEASNADLEDENKDLRKELGE